MGRIAQRIGALRYTPNVAALSGGFYDDFSGATVSPQWTTLLGALATNGGALRASALASDGKELLGNVGFETAGAGGADIWGSWLETAGDGVLADEGVLVHGGSHAAKETAGVARSTSVRQITTSIPGAYYVVSAYTCGDGVNAGRLFILENGGAFPTLLTVAGIAGIVYAQVTGGLAVPAGVSSILTYFACPNVNGGIAYFDDVSLQLQFSALVYNLGSANAIITASMISPAALVTPRSLVLRAQDALNYVCLRLAPCTAGNDTFLETVTAGVRATVAGGTADVDWTAGGTDKVRVLVQGNTYTVDAMKSGASTWTTAFTTTTASFNTATLFGPMVWAATDNSWDDVLVQPA